MSKLDFNRLKWKAMAFGSLENGGHLQVYECEDIPGFAMTVRKLSGEE